MNETKNIIKWLLEGDVSIKYQVHRDILKSNEAVLSSLRKRIATEGFGAKFLELQNEDGSWGEGFYKTKWVSSHYTLMDIRNLCTPTTPGILEAIKKILRENKAEDGGISPSSSIEKSEACVNGMFLNYASYYKIDQEDLESIVDCIVSQQMNDGGFNCRINRSGAVHSSLHTTISTLEGIREYIKNGYEYRAMELIKIEQEAIEFMLKHKLYKSDKTDEVISKAFTMLSYPSRWKYDVLRALVYLVDAKVSYDPRMDDALELILRKKRKDGTWPVQAKHSGKVHFDMEKTGSASRINTLRVLKVLDYYSILSV